ncbi:MAG TPA: hypothetical protein VGO34_10990 [Alphaproteobacteria bacterium]|jgi:hypothetical protein
MTPTSTRDGAAKATADGLRLDLQNVASIIVAARGMIATGQPVDLAALEREVRRLCDEICGLSAEESLPLRPAMVGLIDDLDRLAEDVRRRHAELKGQLESLNTGSRVAAAYVPPGLRRR